MTSEEMYDFLWESKFFQNADVLYHQEDLERLSDQVAHVIRELKNKGYRTPSVMLLEFFTYNLKARQAVTEGCLEIIVSTLSKIIKLANRFNATKDKTEKHLLLETLKLYKVI